MDSIVKYEKLPNFYKNKNNQKTILIPQNGNLAHKKIFTFHVTCHQF